MKEFIEKLIGRLEEEKQRLRNLKNDCVALSDHEVIAIEEGAYNFCKNIVNQLAEEYKGGWIPVSDRLPENNKVVLCWVRSTTIASGETYIIGSCDRGFWFLQTYEIGHHHFPVKDYEVVAWQPLPEPYQKGE